MRDCPDCDAQLGPTGGCKRCGWQPTAEKPVVKEMQPIRCQHGTVGRRCPKCDATADGFLKQIRDMLPKEEPKPAWPVHPKTGGTIEPLCAMCVEKVLPGDWLYRDGRLWHAACWGRRR